MSALFDFNASLNDAAPDSFIWLTVDLMRFEMSGLLMDSICMLFLLCLPYISNTVRVVFDFSASLNDFAPVSPILFPVDMMLKEKSGLLMDAICVLFLLFTTQMEICECCV